MKTVSITSSMEVELRLARSFLATQICIIHCIKRSRDEGGGNLAMFLPTPAGCLSTDRIDHLRLFVTSNNTNVLQDMY